MKSFLSSITGIFHPKGTFRSDPARDWLILLLVGCIVLISSITWNAWFFDRVVRGGGGDASDTSGALDAYESSAVTSIFDARAEAANAYRDTYLFVDPAR